MTRAPLISVVIPAYNEERYLRATLESCLSLRPCPEIVVADGGSTDATRRIAESLGARAIQCPQRGRAFQMNEGARAASGDVLLFLHADTTLDSRCWEALHSALRDAAVCFGGFRRCFAPPSLLLTIGSWLAILRGRIWKIFLGDQAIFVRRDAFERIGGYSPILLFEDIDLCRRLRRVGRGKLLSARVTTSRRRFQAEGNARRLARNVWLWLRYYFGADANRLARVYYPGYYDAGLPDGDSDAATSESSRSGRVSKL